MSNGQIPAAQVAGLADAIDARIGSGAGLVYVHPQPVPDTVWTVVHGLGFKPNVAVICDSDPGVPVYTGVHHDSDNQLTITFPTPESGEATCS